MAAWVLASESDTDRVWHEIGDDGKTVLQTRYEFVHHEPVPETPRVVVKVAHRARLHAVMGLVGGFAGAGLIELVLHLAH